MTAATGDGDVVFCEEVTLSFFFFPQISNLGKISVLFWLRNSLADCLWMLTNGYKTVFFFPFEFADSQNRLQIWNLKFWGFILMTEMESPLEDYADGLGFHINGYFIWRFLYRRVRDALSTIDS